MTPGADLARPRVVRMTQDGALLSDAILWAVAEGLAGYSWDDAIAPAVPAEFDGKPHKAQAWMRFVPTHTFSHPWVDACRSLILLDTWAWAAAASGLSAGERGKFLGPNLDVTARFHADASGSEWLLVDARAPVAADGLIGCEAGVWREDVRLAASGGAQLLCRPIKPRE